MLPPTSLPQAPASGQELGSSAGERGTETVNTGARCAPEGASSSHLPFQSLLCEVGEAVLNPWLGQDLRESAAGETIPWAECSWREVVAIKARRGWQASHPIPPYPDPNAVPTWSPTALPLPFLHFLSAVDLSLPGRRLSPQGIRRVGSLPPPFVPIAEKEGVPMPSQSCLGQTLPGSLWLPALWTRSSESSRLRAGGQQLGGSARCRGRRHGR